MLAVIHYLHTEGVVHRALNLSYFLIDDKFNLRLINYGFSAPIQARDGGGLLMTRIGVAGYMAPEILADQPYDGIRVDLFAIAVALFIIYRGRPPFVNAQPNDQYYRFIHQNRLETFWRID
jgi:serine/threonine protein kinase